jgi:hypothetical protein
MTGWLTSRCSWQPRLVVTESVLPVARGGVPRARSAPPAPSSLLMRPAAERRYVSQADLRPLVGQLVYLLRWPMEYRLEELAELSGDFGFVARRVDSTRLDVVLAKDCILAFCNLVTENDTLVGFDGTPWHSHGTVQFMTGDSTYVEYDELQLLYALALGDLLVFSHFSDGKLHDRWLAHKDEGVDVRHLKPGDELHVTAPMGVPKQSNLS